MDDISETINFLENVKSTLQEYEKKFDEVYDQLAIMQKNLIELEIRQLTSSDSTSDLLKNLAEIKKALSL